MIVFDLDLHSVINYKLGIHNNSNNRISIEREQSLSILKGMKHLHPECNKMIVGHSPHSTSSFKTQTLQDKNMVLSGNLRNVINQKIYSPSKGFMNIKHNKPKEEFNLICTKMKHKDSSYKNISYNLEVVDQPGTPSIHEESSRKCMSHDIQPRRKNINNNNAPKKSLNNNFDRGNYKRKSKCFPTISIKNNFHITNNFSPNTDSNVSHLNLNTNINLFNPGNKLHSDNNGLSHMIIQNSHDISGRKESYRSHRTAKTNNKSILIIV
jgi:hypothetical protein